MTTHVVHIVYSFATGGLENGIVNLINNLPTGEYRHTIVCLAHYDEEFFKRISSDRVDILSVNKKAGKDLKVHLRLFKVLRELKPDIVHTRNLSTIEYQLTAFIAGVGLRIHGEHGWDSADDKANSKAALIRRWLKFFPRKFIALSQEGCHYLTDTIGINKDKLVHICNGVDLNRFDKQNTSNSVNTNETTLKICTVGRLAAVKNQALLVNAFALLKQQFPAQKMQLTIAGEGPSRGELEHLIEKLNLQATVTLAGNQTDVASFLATQNIFVLPSFAEGISNTILEAMASSKPVIATQVGGNFELIEPDVSGQLVACSQVEQMTSALAKYITRPDLIERHGQAGYQRVKQLFSLDQMVAKYHQTYQSLIN